MSVIPQTPQSLRGGGFVPLDPLLGLCPGPAGDLKRSPDPSPTHAPPNPKSLIRPWYPPTGSALYETGPCGLSVLE